MAKTQSLPILRLIRRVLDDPRVKSCSDQELLQRFHGNQDEAAFETILRRHGPMVLDVCRGVLGNEANVEDAFQATFLVLARKAKSIRNAASLASWLHGVAYRVARKAQADSARRNKHEDRVSQTRPIAVAADDLTWRELRQVVHEELNGLAERYRSPLVLCYLEGKTQDEAAAQLGLAKGTLKGHLERGRALLRARLVRRGFGPLAALFAAAWPTASANAGITASLADSTCKAAIQFAAGGAAGAAVSANVAALTEGVLTTMFLTKLKIGAAALAIVAVLFAGTVYLTGAGQTESRGWAAAPADDGKKPAKDRELSEMERKLVGTWQRDGLPGATLTLSADGNFEQTAVGAKVTGTWAAKGDELVREIRASPLKQRIGTVVAERVVQVDDRVLKLKVQLEGLKAEREPEDAGTLTYTRLVEEPKRKGKGPDDKGDKKPEGDLAKLQGTWQAEVRTADDQHTVRLTVEGRNFTEVQRRKSDGREITTRGQIDLDETADPKQMNLKVSSMTSSQGRVPGWIPNEVLAIYKLDNKGLTRRTGLRDRPIGFDKDGTGETVFQRSHG